MKYTLVSLFLLPLLGKAFATETQPAEIYKTDISIYKGKNYVYTSPQGFFTGTITCSLLLDGNLNTPSQAYTYCNNAYEACVMAAIMKGQIDSPSPQLSGSLKLNEKHLEKAIEDRDYHLRTCQLALNASSAGFKHFNSLAKSATED